MLIKLGILFLAVLGLVFVVMPFFNRGVFDFQCETSGCSGQVCRARTIVGDGPDTACEWKPEYGCLKGCEVREGKCSFDPVYEQGCVECVQQCQSIPAENSGCIEECYKLNATVS